MMHQREITGKIPPHGTIKLFIEGAPDVWLNHVLYAGGHLLSITLGRCCYYDRQRIISFDAKLLWRADVPLVLELTNDLDFEVSTTCVAFVEELKP